MESVLPPNIQSLTLDVGEMTERIQFDIELNATINPADTRFMQLEVLDAPDTDNSVVRFCVNKV